MFTNSMYQQGPILHVTPIMKGSLNEGGVAKLMQETSSELLPSMEAIF